LVMVIFTTLFLIATLMLRMSFRTATSSTRDAAKDMLSEPSNGVWRRKIVDTTARVFEYDSKRRSGLLLFFDGLASGFLGIGGGLIVVPILTAVVELPMHLAVATSMLTMIFTSISGVPTYIMLGNVAVEHALPLVVGILPGAQLRTRAARRLTCATLERAFATAVLGIEVLLVITRLYKGSLRHFLRPDPLAAFDAYFCGFCSESPLSVEPPRVAQRPHSTERLLSSSRIFYSGGFGM
jgi:uncharacterized membrane protein YfcA